MTESKLIMQREYDDESLIDFHENLLDAIDNAKIPQDNNGFLLGTFRITIMWEYDNE